MGFLTKEGLQNLTNKLVQGDAIKVASHRGKNVKEIINNIQRECENVALPNTMTLENRINEFKVGQGRDIDISGDVEEGKIEVELQGKTWQNLLMPNLDKADNEGYVMYPKGEYKTYPDKNNYKRDVNMIKPNTIYTFIVDIKSIAKGMPLEINFNHSNHCFNYIAISEGVGVYKIKAVSKSDLSECTRIIGDRVKLGTYEEDTVYRIILLEGDHTQTPLEELPKYFKDIKSSFEDGVVDVEVQGKNLFDGQLRTFNTNDTYIDNIGQHHNGDNNIPIKPNTSYTMTFETISGDSNIYIWNGNEKVLTIPSSKDTVSFKTPLECNSLSFYRNVADYTKDRLKYKIQLEENSKSISYEPYYKKKISFNIGESLRSLPNGVCDEIRNNNGQWKLIRRVGKYIFNGNEDFSLANNDIDSADEFTTVFAYKLNSNIQVSGGFVCDKFKYYKYDADFRTYKNEESCSDGGGYKRQYFRISNSKLSTADVNGFKQWLSENPTTVYYELLNPIITSIKPIEFEVKPLATINISSDIAPTSTHEVILNRAGQIEQGIELIANLKSRINDLEYIYDSNLIATQYRLNNLKLNYELEREED